MMSAGAPPTVVLADDDHFFRDGLRRMLTEAGISVVGEAADGNGAVALARRLAPDLVLIDPNMPRASGLGALDRIIETTPDARIVVLTVSTLETEVLEALAAGACGYLLKDTPVDELVAAIRLAASGHLVLSRNVLQALAARALTDEHNAEQAVINGVALTERELAVIRLIAQGADNATIGRELSISRHTVKRYVTNILQKLGVQTRVEAAVYAIRRGLV